MNTVVVKVQLVVNGKTLPPFCLCRLLIQHDTLHTIIYNAARGCGKSSSSTNVVLLTRSPSVTKPPPPRSIVGVAMGSTSTDESALQSHAARREHAALLRVTVAKVALQGLLAALVRAKVGRNARTDPRNWDERPSPDRSYGATVTPRRPHRITIVHTSPSALMPWLRLRSRPSCCQRRALPVLRAAPLRVWSLLL